jgi:hypothetical protein
MATMNLPLLLNVSSVTRLVKLAKQLEMMDVIFVVMDITDKSIPMNVSLLATQVNTKTMMPKNAQHVIALV